MIGASNSIATMGTTTRVSRFAARSRQAFCALLALIGVIGISALLAACGRDPPLPGRVDPVVLGSLIAAVVPGPDTYFLDAGGKPAGIEYDLLKRLSNSLNVTLELKLFDDHDAAMRAAENGQVHVVAMGTSGMPPPGPLTAGPVYQIVQPVLVYRIDDPLPAGWRDVDQQVVLITQDHAIGELAAASAKESGAPAQFVPAPSSRKIAETISSGTVRYGVMYRHTLSYLRNVYLDLDVAFPIGPPRELRWRIPRTNTSLNEKVERFFVNSRKDGTIARLVDRYYGHTQRVDGPAAQAFQDRIRQVLPFYRELFQTAQQATGIEWRLLAAIAYQESQWDPLATSPTNVRGMMMLTEDTSAQMKVTDRLDPAQSIAAGAQLLSQLKQTVPERIREPDRTWMALAAFNVGYAHLEDARILAQQQKLNPDSWTDLKKTLPLLAKPDFAAKAKRGFARGGQAVIFVENIRALHDILTQFEDPHHPAVATAQ